MVRKQNNVKTEHAQIAVLIEELVPSTEKFTIKTDTFQVYIELMVGQGETLEAGTPYSLIYDRETHECKIVTFQSYAYA